MKVLPSPDPLWKDRGLGLLLLFAVGYFLLVFNRGFNAVDEGYFLHHVELFRQGRLPYRDFYFQFTPLSFWWHGLLFEGFGPSLMVERVYALLLFLSVPPLFAWIASAFAPRPYRLFPAAAIIGFSLGFGRMAHYSIDALYAAWLALAALIALFRRGHLGWLALAALLAGVSFSMKQNTGGAAALAVCLAAVMVVRDRGRKTPWGRVAAALAAGLAAPLAVLVVFARRHLAEEFFVATFTAGATKAWTWGFLLQVGLPVLAIFLAYLGCLAITVRYARRADRGKRSSMIAAAIFVHLAILAAVIFTHAVGFFLIAGVALLPLGLTLIALYLLQGDRELSPPEKQALLIVGVFSLLLQGFGFLSGADLGHNLMYGVTAFIFLGYLAKRAVQAVSPVGEAPARRLAAVLAVALMAAGMVLSAWNPLPFLSEGPLFEQTLPLELERAHGIRVSPALKEEAEGIVRTVQRETGPQDPILVFPLGAIYYFLSDRMSPTYWTFLFFENFHAADEPAMIEQIERAKIPLIIVADPGGSLGPLLHYQGLQRVYGYIQDRYQAGEVYGRYRIYRRKP